MKRNSETLGIQYRQMPSKDMLVGVNVVTQKLSVKQATCKCCREMLNYTEYYWVKKKRVDSYVWARKPICCTCWNNDTLHRTLEKGYHTVSYKVNKEERELEMKKKEQEMNTLEMFLA